MPKEETVNTRLLNNPDELIPMGRKEFYTEQRAVFAETGAPTRSVEVVNVFLFNPQLELFIQKRSFVKAHNAGLLDKSIGGHITHGDSPDYTVMVETVQELQTPSIVLQDPTDFQKTFVLLQNYLDTVAIIQRGPILDMIVEKIIDDQPVKIANRSYIYFGLYNGRVRHADQEAKGVLFYNLAELQKEMGRLPAAFSADLHTLIPLLNDEFKQFFDCVQIKK